ncbi:hypothetical protein HYX03_01180 [Candidatus Woesearchaeota archaeon]|nr:hypothetical protein [Candidatus Woesearchaeota archaeon]
MKSQKHDEKQKSKAVSGYHRKRIWKTVAISVVAVFVLIIAGGLVRVNYLRSSFVKPSQSQTDYAAKIAAEKLQSMNVNPSAFQMNVGRKIRRLHDDEAARSIIQVAFNNNASSHTYLIDVNTGEVLLHSETDVYGAWTNHKMYSHRDSFYSSLKGRRLSEKSDVK